ncbi:zinc-dependent metalloprotease family protein [Sphingobacterium sp.]|uniref:zinc-dependent metalloprotease family protein n=1 Tax=Sphingobacterium sp. TaxID=341027 RepID=UPI00391A265E
MSNGQSRKGDFGNATGTTIKINKEMIESTLCSNPVGDRNKLIAGTFVHEKGHNLGASHGDPGSIMNQMNMNEIGRGSNTIGAGGTGVYNYSYPSKR